MKELDNQPAFLLLADGTMLEGQSFGSIGTSFGEVVFNTGMTGYQEVITDPSYFNQIVLFTYPEIGNTGINSTDNESARPQVKGIIVRQLTSSPSNWRSEKSLDNWLSENDVVGIKGVDTRALVRHLRNTGTMNGVINSDLKSNPGQLLKKLKKSPSMKGMNLVDKVTTNKIYYYEKSISEDFERKVINNLDKPYKVAAIDFGIKKSILDRLSAYGCEVIVYPASVEYSTLIDSKPEGIFLSNGPGDPAAVLSAIELSKNLIKNHEIPMFGICLGHQILGIALGGQTFKLSYGHRGLNHPCGLKGRVDITSQNHGFALDPSSLDKKAINITALNLNDQTVAGFEVRNRPIFGVQYHPEASPGPHDSDYHFKYFVSHMDKRRKKVV